MATITWRKGDLFVVESGNRRVYGVVIDPDAADEALKVSQSVGLPELDIKMGLISFGAQPIDIRKVPPDELIALRTALVMMGLPDTGQIVMGNPADE